MIRVNLLPVKDRRRGKKPAAAARQIEIPVATIAVGVLCVLALCVIAYLHYQNERQKVVVLQEEIQTIEEETEKLKVDIRKVDEAKKKKEQLSRKLDIIKNLKAGKSGPVKLLDALSTAMPKELWLTELSEDGSRMQMTGVAFDAAQIAAFMKNLESSKVFYSVELTQVQNNSRTEFGQALKGFQLSCSIRYTGGSR